MHNYFADTGTDAAWFSQASVMLPLPPLLVDGVLQVLNQRGRLGHLHLYLSNVLAGVIGQARSAGLLVHDQHPLVGVGDIDKERVLALGDLRLPICRSPSVSSVVAAFAPARHTG